MKYLPTDHDASTAECVMFSDVLGPIAYALFPSDSYTVIIELLRKCVLICEKIVVPVR